MITKTNHVEDFAGSLRTYSMIGGLASSVMRISTRVLMPSMSSDSRRLVRGG